MPRTQFEYIRDHLGYRLELQRMRLPRTTRASVPFDVRIELINRGFSTLHSPRPVIVVLIDSDDRVFEFPASEADPRMWQPFAPEIGVNGHGRSLSRPYCLYHRSRSGFRIASREYVRNISPLRVAADTYRAPRRKLNVP